MKPRIDITRDPHPDYPALEHKFTVYYDDGAVCGHGWRATRADAETAAKKTADYHAREHAGGGKMDCKLTVDQQQASRKRGQQNSNRKTCASKAAAQARRPNYIETATTRWHGAPPDWVLALAQAANAAESQRQLAETMGSHASAISAALNNSKHAPDLGVTKLERRVRELYMQ